MGCWNHTCAVTGLPIYESEEVEVIMLLASAHPEQASHCYPTSYHIPIPLTFQGQYNDYGAVENCKGIALPVLINAIRDNMVELEVGENKYHDIAAKKDEFDVDKMFELDHENRLFIFQYPMQHDMRNCIPLKHIVVRKTVYDTIVESCKLEYWDKETSTTMFRQLKDLRKEYDLFLKDVNNVMNGAEADIEWAIRKRIGDTTVAELISFRDMTASSFNKLLTINEIIVSMVENKTENIKDFIDNAVRFALFAWFIEDTRREWHVPSGVGSQNDNTENHVLAANLTISEAKKLKNYWNE